MAPGRNGNSSSSGAHMLRYVHKRARLVLPRGAAQRTADRPAAADMAERGLGRAAGAPQQQHRDAPCLLRAHLGRRRRRNILAAVAIWRGREERIHHAVVGSRAG
jgi:hypothetical protein